MKLTSALLAFLFILAPIFPVLAQEAAGNSAAPASAEATAGNPAESANTSVSPTNTNSADTVNTDVGKTKEDSSTAFETNNDKKDTSSPVGDLGQTKKSKDPSNGLGAGKNGKNAPTGDQPISATSGGNFNYLNPQNSSYQNQKQVILNPNDINGPLTYDYPITVPPGRNGLQPDLSLSYNSQLSAEESVFGYGWNINIPYIERINRKGTDKLYTENYFNSSLSGELVNISGSSYGSKVDNGEFLQYTFSNDSWTVKDKKGTQYKFGFSSATRLDNPNDSTKIFRWMLEEVRDTNNNYIKYEYFKDNGQIYPSKIIYTGNGVIDGIFELEFVREAVANTIKSYKTGFLVTTNYRINEIRTKVNGNWVKKYTLGYTTANAGMQSLLASIAESGQDDLGVVKTLPAVSFTYESAYQGWVKDTSWHIPFYSYDPNGNYGETLGQGVRIADINGDGLPDMLKSTFLGMVQLPDGTFEESNTSLVYINNGHDWVRDDTWRIPMSFFYRDSPNGYGQSVQITDINGDNLPDLVRSINVSTICSVSCFPFKGKRVYLNNGHGWTEDTSWQIPLYFYYPLDSSDSPQAVRIVDINGDGLVDLLKSKLNGSTRLPDGTWQEYNTSEVYLNNGNGWIQSNSWSIPLAFFYSKDSWNDYLNQSIQVIDINGDGLSDIVRSLRPGGASVCINGNCQIGINGGSKIYLNNGNGWVNDTSWQMPLPFYELDMNSSGFVRSIFIADANGDNLPDLFKSMLGSSVQLPDGTWQETNNSEVYLNNGTSWVKNNSQYLPLAMSSYFDTEGKLSHGSQTMDVNGDGLQDIVRLIGTQAGLCLSSGNCQYISDANSRQVYLNNSRKADLLTRITYSTGGKTDITYKATPLYTTGSSLSNPNLPFIIDTVQTLTTNDGFGNSSTTTYSYEGGKYYYNTAFDRKFAGFSKITKTDSAGNVTKTYYHQGDSTNSGQGEYLDHISKAGKPYRAEIYDNSNNLYSKTINKWENYDLGSGRNFVKLTQKIDSNYDGNATHKDKAESYTYDNTNGNLTEKIQWSEVTGSDSGTFTDIGSDKLDTTISYVSNLTTNVIGLPSQETTLDQNNAKVKESKYYYDSLALGSADKGNLTKEEKWVSGTNYINSQKSYNSYGLVTQETDPRGKITTYAYDSYNLYPSSVTNALNQATQYGYDYSIGKPKQTTDPNGYVFQTVYDGLDRVIEEKQPDLTTPATLVTKTAYIYTDTANAVSVKKTDYLDTTTSVDSYSYFDGLGRIIQTRKEAEDTNNFSVKDLVYNNRGLLNKESLPYFSFGYARTTPSAVEGLYSTYFYDPLERITSTANAVGTITNAYDDWKVTTTDAKGNQKDLYKDTYDRLIQVGEHNGASTYTTTYTYDGAGNLTKITDASGNIRNFTYDGLGRRLTAEDLHAPSDTTFGTWTYTYDASNNLTSTLNPKNQIVNYTYDDINRQLTEDYTGQAGTEVTNTYDTCVNGKGRLCSVTNSAATEAKEYNALGLVSKETKTISSVNYITQYTYDRQGNTISFTNPDGSILQYTYNTAGLLEQVRGKEAIDTGLSDVVTDFDYSPLEKITTQTYANGATTTNTYDAAHLYRLSSKVTTIPGGNHVQDLSYTYDANGNITKIIDNSATNSKKTVDYTYDSLNRLLSATTTGAVNNQNYTETYTYDAIGNITSKNGLAYSYAGNVGSNYANPHAVTSIESKGVQSQSVELLSSPWNLSGNNGDDQAYQSIPQDILKGKESITIKYNLHGLCALGNDASAIIFDQNGWKYASLSNYGQNCLDGEQTVTIPLSAFPGLDTNANLTGSFHARFWYSGAFTVDILSAKLNSAGAAVTRYVNYIYDKNGNLVSAGENLPEISWYNASWTNRRMITIDRAKVSGTLTDFPLLINIADPELKTVANNGFVAKSDGGDILFTSSDGTTKLSHEIERYDGLTGTLVAWVKIPSISSAADTKIILYYGNASSAGQQDASNVFDPSAKGVWHLKENPADPAPQMKDTTANANHATSCCSMTSANRISAKVGYGTSLDGADDYIKSPTVSARTVEMWVYPSSTQSKAYPTYYNQRNQQNLLGYWWVYTYGASTAINWQYATGTSRYTKSWANAIAYNAWNHLAFVFDDTAKTVTLYKNGTSLGTQSAPNALFPSSADFYVGSYQGNSASYPLNGRFDEVRVYDRVLSSDEIKTQFNNQNSPSTFYSVSGMANAWDYKNRLAKTVLGKTAVSYTYDSDGQRVKYAAGTTSTIYPTKYYNITGGVPTKQIFAGDALIATVKGTSTAADIYFVHPDHLTGSNVITNGPGAVEELMDYFPYGNIRLDEKAGNFSEQHKYTGYEYDADTGLNYAGARYYEPVIGRFISQDPLIINNPEKVLGDPQSLSYYAYSRNNPLRFIDPTGLYNIETGRVEEGDTPDIIVNSINKAFGINTNWDTVKDVSFYQDRFKEQTLDQIVGQSLYVGKNITTDITNRLDGLNQSRSTIARLLGKGSLALFAPKFPWDIKSSKDSILGGGANRQYRSYIYNGELIRYDAPGNINYGYVARAVGLNGYTIQTGAMMEQAADDFSKDWSLSFTDNSGDSKYVQKGIDSYNAKQSWWRRLINW